MMARRHVAVGSSHHFGLIDATLLHFLPETTAFEEEEEEHTADGDDQPSTTASSFRDMETPFDNDEEEDRHEESELHDNVLSLPGDEQNAETSLVELSGDYQQYSPSAPHPKGYSQPEPEARRTTTAVAAATKPPPSPPPPPEALFHRGNLELWLPMDDQSLNPFHCFIRKECIEAFTVAASTMPSRVFPDRTIDPFQVGIQCKFCKHRPIALRSDGAVSFPSCVGNIYHSIDTWHRRHSSTCLEISPPIRTQIMELQRQSRFCIGGNRRYWETSATLLGLDNHTEGGIRFYLDMDVAQHVRSNAGKQRTASLSKSSVPVSRPVVRFEDAATTNPFLYRLFSQMETCLYSEEDMAQSKGSKRDIEFGRPGFQCKNCKGQRGYGRYFPSSVHTLARANSDRNLYKHITRCHRCPPSVKASLETLFQELKSNNRCREPRGSRKQFFQRVWDRMHTVDGAS